MAFLFGGDIMYLSILGTMSNVGKSTLTTALCNYFTKKGFNVVPFKAQNMSQKYITIQNGNGKIAIAQYIQSIACRKEPLMEYNPILLLPGNGKIEVLFMGKSIGAISSKEYMYSTKERLFNEVKNILVRLEEEHDLVIIEGAGAAIEPNLKDSEIVNMRIAKSVGANVILVADISKGGAFAQIAGTIELMDQKEKALVRGFIFNKFYGDKTLLKDAPEKLANRYKIEYLGTIPYFENNLPDEDVLKIKENEISLADKERLIEEIDKITEHVTEHIDIQKIEQMLFKEMKK